MKLLLLRALALITIFCALTVSAQHGILYGASVVAVGGFGITLLAVKFQPGILAVYTGTSLVDLFIPEVYLDIQPNDNLETNAFAASGIAVKDPQLERVAESGAKKVEVPLWDDLDATGEPNYSDDTDTKAPIAKIGTDSFNGRNSYLNKAFGAADLAREIGGTTPGNGDPMTRIRNRFAAYWDSIFQARIIAMVRGILADNMANDAGDMIYNIAAESTGAQSDATMISSDAVVEATFTLGDRFKNIKAIAMHSFVYKRLVRQQLIEYVRDADGTLLYTNYLGMRVVVDDGLPAIPATTSGIKYLSVLFGAGAIGYGEGTPMVPAAVGREELEGNGGGNEYIIERKTWLIHPWGFDWTENTVAAPGHSATLANLRLAANWNRVLPRKAIPLAFLQTNG